MTQNGIIVIGAGGHAKVIIDIFYTMKEPVDFCIGNPKDPEYCRGVPVLRENEEKNLLSLKEKGYYRAFIAIGSNAIRNQIAESIIEKGFELVNAISPYAVISFSAQLGKGIAVMPGAIINAESIIENLVIINTGATIDHDCCIRQGAHIAPQCALAGNVKVGKRSFLGIGCKVIPGIHIGQDAILGAGSVAIRNIPDRVTAVGIPAKVEKHL